MPILAIDAAVEEVQRKRLAEVRHDRSDDDVRRSLAALKAAAAEPTTNLMPPIIDAVRTYATLGEVMGTLADVFGTWTEIPAI